MKITTNHHGGFCGVGGISDLSESDHLTEYGYVPIKFVYLPNDFSFRLNNSDGMHRWRTRVR